MRRGVLRWGDGNDPRHVPERGMDGRRHAIGELVGSLVSVLGGVPPRQDLRSLMNVRADKQGTAWATRALASRERQSVGPAAECHVRAGHFF